MSSTNQLPPAVVELAKTYFQDYVPATLMGLTDATAPVGQGGTMLLVPYDAKRAANFAERLRRFTTAVNKSGRCKVFVAFGAVVGGNLYGITLLPKALTPTTTATENDNQPNTNSRKAITVAQAFTALPDLVPKLERWLTSAEARAALRHDDEQLADYEVDSSDPDDVGLTVLMTSESHSKTMQYNVEFDSGMNIIGLTEIGDTDCKGCMADFSDAFGEAWRLWDGR